MTDWPGIITAIFGGIALVMFTAAQAYQIMQGHRLLAQGQKGDLKLDGLAIAVDGLTDKRVAEATEAALAKGNLEGQAQQRAQPLVAAAAPLPAPLTAEQQEATLQETIKTAQAQLEALRTPTVAPTKKQ